MTDKQDKPLLDKPLMESLSALVDGEASELELRRVLKSNESEEAQVRTLWQRFQIASALLRKDCSAPSQALQATAFSASVLAAIEAEERGEFPSLNQAPNSLSEQGRRKGLMGQMGKLAIAASVALAVLLGMNQMQVNESPEELVAGGSAIAEYPGDTSAVVPDGYRVPTLNAATVSSVTGAPVPYRNTLTLPNTANAGAEVSPEVQALLQRMLMLHSDKAADEIGLTIVPGVRLSSQAVPGE